MEGILAKKRAKMANNLIPFSHRSGKILDIGSGSQPFFLLNVEFSEKYGLDKVVSANAYRHLINFTNYNIEEGTLPFENDYFDVITMLAALEHIQPKSVLRVLREVFRVMRPNGVLIITTPAGYTAGALRIMSKLKILSSTEIEDHKNVYNHKKIGSLLEAAGFKKEKMSFGFFEFFMNLWIVATK